ncbi:trypsin-like peptidase domain-containing protein [Roseibacterium beibuensis]|uniref:Trypsin-like serine protease n=1 Tax=[Roseibacterium] beibuensis TaxID=1193142 RepID=A0ABP9LCD7_9RHOB|nr:trypsin-like peptidase domain-containing protein [Roseibacterium beibuensis]MCS6624314.1 trypsin-like peptidase domain-containing protein [Roseibacterium beibuensis]
MKYLSVLLMAVLAAFPALAQQDGALHSLTTGDDIRGWEAVGRLDTGVSFCTATLITPDLVLTAAHCLYHPRTGARLSDDALLFQAGLRNGRPEALRGVRASHVSPGYVAANRTELSMIALDLALLELDLPLRTGRIAPIPSGRGAVPRTEVTVVSYGQDREAFASIEEGCEILMRRDSVRSLSCRVDQGSSGAPVMRMTADGPEIIAVMAASGRDSAGGAMSLAVALEGRLDDLMAMQAGHASGGAVTIIRPGATGRGRLEGHFIRP